MKKKIRTFFFLLVSVIPLNAQVSDSLRLHWGVSFGLNRFSENRFGIQWAIVPAADRVSYDVTNWLRIGLGFKVSNLLTELTPNGGVETKFHGAAGIWYVRRGKNATWMIGPTLAAIQDLPSAPRTAYSARKFNAYTQQVLESGNGLSAEDNHYYNSFYLDVERHSKKVGKKGAPLISMYEANIRIRYFTEKLVPGTPVTTVRLVGMKMIQLWVVPVALRADVRFMGVDAHWGQLLEHPIVLGTAEVSVRVVRFKQLKSGGVDVVLGYTKTNHPYYYPGVVPGGEYGAGYGGLRFHFGY